ncbi:MAG: spore germination protein [Chitinophagales bacterium]
MDENPLDLALAANLTALRKQFAGADDVVFRELTLGKRKLPALMAFFDGLVNHQALDRLTAVLTVDFPEETGGKTPPQQLAELMRSRVIPVGEVREVPTLGEAVQGMLEGEVLVFFDGCPTALAAAVQGGELRSISEPISEPVVQGPRAGFIEDLAVNLSLVRRLLRDPNLKAERSSVGARTRTRVAVLYLSDLVNPEVLGEVRRRLATVQIDGTASAGTVGQMIEDRWTSPFPQIEATERPDRMVLALLEGRVGILVDNTPFTLIVPSTFNSMMHSPEDYAIRWPLATFSRFIRFFAVIITLVLPAFYLALVTFHPEMLPTRLLVSIGVSAEDVPYPMMVEVLLLQLAIELIREAGLRMPTQLRQNLAVVGGLIVGQAAVQAGLVSTVTVVVVAVTGLSIFAVPTFPLAYALLLCRFALILAAGTLGLFGLVTGLLMLLTHLVSLRTFGVYYTEPEVPAHFTSWKDTVLRAPSPALQTRPAEYHPQDARRAADARPEVGGDG